MLRVKNVQPWVKAGIIARHPLVEWMPGRWLDDALCPQTDPEAFYPAGKGKSATEAKKMCGRCPVREECLAYALITGDHHGVWGGVTERPRQKMKTVRVPGTDIAVPLESTPGKPTKDTEVERLGNLGLSASQIAEQLGRDVRNIEGARRRIRQRNAAAASESAADAEAA